MNLNTLIAECSVYDFKLMLEEKNPKSWLKSVCASANGLGGSLIFDTEDDVKHISEVTSGKIRSSL